MHFTRMSANSPACRESYRPDKLAGILFSPTCFGSKATGKVTGIALTFCAAATMQGVLLVTTTSTGRAISDCRIITPAIADQIKTTLAPYGKTRKNHLPQARMVFSA
ncbi:MAG: hypothetical protein WCO44_01145 [Bacteroidota bacterium]